MDKKIKKIKKILAATGVAAAIGTNAYRASKFKPEPRKWAPLPDTKVDVDKFACDLSDAIKIKTISNLDPDKVDWAEFDKFHAFLEERFPLLHENLEKEVIGKASLMFRWKGSNPDLDPIALLGHQDVVPISAGTEGDWVHPPFSGVIADGFIWGRGALDMKNHLIGVCEAVESLLGEGFVPVRDVYLLFGHNEEVLAEGSNNGAMLMCRTLKDRGIRLDCVIDEGGAIIPVNAKGIITKELAGIGIAEKGHCDFEISVYAKGGHSSQPPKHTALGELADVIKDLENNQFKAKISPLMDELFTKIGKNTSLPVRQILCNYKLLKPVVLQVCKQIPPAASMLRTTTAVTMASGSPAANVLPQKASIVANFRIMPGQTVSDVEDHIKKVVRNKNIEVRLIKGSDPSNISPTDSRCFKALDDICYRMNTNSIVAPYLVMGGTDARNYEPICDNVYRYSPFKFDTELLLTTHGTNERCPLECLEKAVKFFKHYITIVSAE
ncbi:MAG TPA: M20/M25/M40 family metallo-hydrolase [Clostridiales bacterium]|nr:M20/M25/M40 family metallo-hydrolase [Clostridiales bacterium]